MNEMLLQAADAVIVFADLQEGIISVGITNDAHRLRTSVAALADLATIFALPVIISSVPTTSGTVAPALAENTSRLLVRRRTPWTTRRFARPSMNQTGEP